MGDARPATAWLIDGIFAAVRGVKSAASALAGLIVLAGCAASSNASPRRAGITYGTPVTTIEAALGCVYPKPIEVIGSPYPAPVECTFQSDLIELESWSSAHVEKQVIAGTECLAVGVDIAFAYGDGWTAGLESGGFDAQKAVAEAIAKRLDGKRLIINC